MCCFTRDVHRLKINRYFTGAFVLLEKLIHDICRVSSKGAGPRLHVRGRKGDFTDPSLGLQPAASTMRGFCLERAFPPALIVHGCSVFDLKGFSLWGKHTSQKAYTLNLKSDFPESGYEQGLGQDSVHVPSLDQDSDRAAWKAF